MNIETSFKAVLAGAMLFMASIGTVQAQEGRWVFRVFLDKKEIGYHEFKVAGNEAHRQVEIDARFDVKILFVNAYSYSHQNRETWSDGCLASIDAFTDDNGSESLVSGFRSDEGFVVKTEGGPATLGTPCLRSFAYWDHSIVESERLLNSQTGEVLDVDIVSRGKQVLEIGGTDFEAEKYELTMEDGVISLWYGASDRRWLALEAPAKGGRTIRYQPVILPGPMQGQDKRLAME